MQAIHLSSALVYCFIRLHHLLDLTTIFLQIFASQLAEASMIDFNSGTITFACSDGVAGYLAALNLQVQQGLCDLRILNALFVPRIVHSHLLRRVEIELFRGRFSFVTESRVLHLQTTGITTVVATHQGHSHVHLLSAELVKQLDDFITNLTTLLDCAQLDLVALATWARDRRLLFAQIQFNIHAVRGCISAPDLTALQG